MRLRTLSMAIILVTSLILGVVPPQASGAPTQAQRLTLTSVVSGLNSPVDLRAPVGDDRLFVVELSGRILIVNNGVLKSKPFLDIRAQVSTGGERGLLGLAFHPEYDDNGLFYVYYTDNGGDVRISEFSVSASKPNRADSSSERILLEVDQPFTNHNGGGFGFGPSGYLYIGLGDGGGGGDPGDHGQNPNTLLGSLLRIDVDRKSGNREYGIPSSNPFKEGGGKKEVYAFGLRNPWRLSIDRATGLIYIGDVGQDRREEIDVLTSSESAAKNFGWDVMEGSLCFEPSVGCNQSGKTLPIHEYKNPDLGVSVIGGYVYRGNAIPWLRGTYFYSDLAGRRLKSFRYENGKVRKKTDWTSQVGLVPSSVFSFGQDGLGELYVLAGSTVYRIDPHEPTKCDFDGDGDDDLPVGIPGEDVQGLEDAGAVAVFPTVSGAPGVSGDVVWHQNDDGVKSVARSGERFGANLACGDFDGDGFADLAVGAPGDRPLGGADGGAVNVFYGSSTGLTNTDQLFHQGGGGLGGSLEPGDEFGAALASGDFDGDGYDDLVVGVPGEDLVGVTDAGMIYVLYGSEGSLTTSGSLGWHQDSPNIKQTAETGDRFGAALATGDFDGDGYADLAVGSPGEGIGGSQAAGLVHVFSGKRSTGLTVLGDLIFHQDMPGIKEVAAAGDGFGAALATGPVNADGYDDLLVGVSGKSVASKDNAGLVHYLPGSKTGVTDYGDRVIHQDLPEIRGKAEAGDSFGASIAVGDVDGDGFADLVVGIPDDDVEGVVDAGAVAVVFGSSVGLSSRDQLWHQDDPGILDAGETADRFGERVTLLDFEKDQMLDLVVGVPSEDVFAMVDSGDLAILFGRSEGLTSSGDLRLNQDTDGVVGKAETGDALGDSLSP